MGVNFRDLIKNTMLNIEEFVYSLYNYTTDQVFVTQNHEKIPKIIGLSVGVITFIISIFQYNIGVSFALSIILGVFISTLIEDLGLKERFSS